MRTLFRSRQSVRQPLLAVHYNHTYGTLSLEPVAIESISHGSHNDPGVAQPSLNDCNNSNYCNYLFYLLCLFLVIMLIAIAIKGYFPHPAANTTVMLFFNHSTSQDNVTNMTTPITPIMQGDQNEMEAFRILSNVTLN